jgi:ParB family chromosome partitioning protein
MVESIKEHGVLSPVIVRKQGRKYEMLSGHNRANAAKLAGLSEVPAIVKTELSDEEAYVYVIETNVMQRSFTELLPSEKAAVLVMRYDKVICQGRRNDIVEEIARLTCGHDVHKLKSRDAIGEEYGMTGRNIGRYMRVNKLIKPLKDKLDAGELPLVAAVDVSYLTEEEQAMLWKMVEQQGLKVKPVYAQKLRKESSGLTETRMEEIMETLQAKRSGNADVNLKLSKTVCMKYFDGMSAEQMAAVVEQALAEWFERSTLT